MFSEIAKFGATFAATVLGTLSLVADAGAVNFEHTRLRFRCVQRGAGIAAFTTLVPAYVRASQEGFG